MDYNFSICHSPIGFYRVEYYNNCLIKLQIEPCEPSDFGENTPFSDEVQQQITDYFEGRRLEFDLEIDWSRFTPFARCVYRELQKIPYGETRTYKQIATAVGNPLASRAVGMVNSRNPIHLVIPCHRVIGANGSLTGYAGGLSAKRALLLLESSK